MSKSSMIPPPNVSSWRTVSCQIIHEVLERTRGLPEAEIKQALFDAYPFGERRYTPYKIWLEEIRRMRGRIMLTARQMAAREQPDDPAQGVIDFEPEHDPALPGGLNGLEPMLPARKHP